MVVQRGWLHPFTEPCHWPPTPWTKGTQFSCGCESCSRLTVDYCVWCHPLMQWVLFVAVHQSMMDGYYVFVTHSALAELLTAPGVCATGSNVHIQNIDVFSPMLWIVHILFYDDLLRCIIRFPVEENFKSLTLHWCHCRSQTLSLVWHLAPIHCRTDRHSLPSWDSNQRIIMSCGPLYHIHTGRWGHNPWLASSTHSSLCGLDNVWKETGCLFFSPGSDIFNLFWAKLIRFCGCV